MVSDNEKRNKCRGKDFSETKETISALNINKALISASLRNPDSLSPVFHQAELKENFPF